MKKYANGRCVCFLNEKHLKCPKNTNLHEMEAPQVPLIGPEVSTTQSQDLLTHRSHFSQGRSDATVACLLRLRWPLNNMTLVFENI